MKLKGFMLETEMEEYLLANGYDIFDELDGGKVVDSVKVSDIAVEEFGYNTFINEDGIIEFSR